MMSSTLISSVSLLHKTSRVHVAMHLFRSRLGKKSKCLKNSTDTLRYHLVCHVFDAFCDLLLNRHMAKWNLLVLHNVETKQILMTSLHLSFNRSYVRQHCLCILKGTEMLSTIKTTNIQILS